MAHGMCSPHTRRPLLFARIAVIILIEWRDTELLPIIVIDQSCSSVRQLFSPCCAGADMLAPATKRRVFLPAFAFASAFTQIDNLSTLVTPQITTQKLLPGSILVPAEVPKACEAVL